MYGISTTLWDNVELVAGRDCRGRLPVPLLSLGGGDVTALLEEHGRWRTRTR
jgi:hypothetical protein